MAAGQPSKSAVVDYQKLWNNLVAVQNLKDDLKAVLEKYHLEFSKIEANLRAENQELLELGKKSNKQQNVQNLDQKRDDFERKVIDIQKKAEKRRKAVIKAHAEADETIKKAIHNIIIAKAKSEGIMAVHYKENLIYNDECMDITDAVFQEAERKTKDIRLKVEH